MLIVQDVWEASMLGLMQDWPLLCHRIIDHAALNHAQRCVHSRSVEGPLQTTTYADIRNRALKVAKRLERDGIGLGDRVATLAWNTAGHLEACYGIIGIRAAPPCCRRWRSPGRMYSGFHAATWSCRWCRCSTPTAGRWRWRRRWSARAW